MLSIDALARRLDVGRLACRLCGLGCGRAFGRGYHRRAADLYERACRKGDNNACTQSAAHLSAGSPSDQAEAARRLDKRCNAGNAEACAQAGESHQYDDPAKAIALLQRACSKLVPSSDRACATLEEMLQRNVMGGGFDTDQSRAQRQKVLVAFCEAGVARGCFFAGRNLHDAHDLDGAAALLRKGCFVAQQADFRACHLLTKFHDPDGSSQRRLDELCAGEQKACDEYMRSH